MTQRERWCLLGSLIVHLAIVFFVGSGLAFPTRETIRVEVDLEGAAAPATAPGLEAPIPSQVPVPPAAETVPARPAVAMQMALPSMAPPPPDQAVEEDGSLSAPGAPVLPPQTAAALTRSGDGGGGRGSKGFGKGSPLQGYLAAVRQRVDAAKRYPKIAEQQRNQGRALVAFSLSAAGELLSDPKVVRSSGFGHLDRAALRAVRRGAPYPRFPGKLRDLPAALQIEVSFILL
jgi:protein TonB